MRPSREKLHGGRGLSPSVESVIQKSVIQKSCAHAARKKVDRDGPEGSHFQLQVALRHPLPSKLPEIRHESPLTKSIFDRNPVQIFSVRICRCQTTCRGLLTDRFWRPEFRRFFEKSAKFEVLLEGARGSEHARKSILMAPWTHSEPRAGAAASW